MDLSQTSQKFILHWGEMGTRWGVNRTVAQIHALLYLTGKPLPADEIADTLGVARSNVSNSIRELQAWNLAKMVHVMGDRRDHFEASTDIWELSRTVVRERKEREILPTIEMLRELLNHPEIMLDGLERAQRMREMLTMLQTIMVSSIVSISRMRWARSRPSSMISGWFSNSRSISMVGKISRSLRSRTTVRDSSQMSVLASK